MISAPIGPGFFIFFNYEDATDQGKPFDPYDYKGYEKPKKLEHNELKELVSKPIFEQTIEVVDDMAKSGVEAKSRESMRDILGLDVKLDEPDLKQAYINYQTIELYKEMRRNEELLLIILAATI